MFQSDSTPTHDLPTVKAIEWEVDQEAPTRSRWERPSRAPSDLGATHELWASPEILYAQMRAANPDATPIRFGAAEPEPASLPASPEDSFSELTPPLAVRWCEHSIPQGPVPISFAAPPLSMNRVAAIAPAEASAPVPLRPLLISLAALGAALGALIAVLYRIVQALPAP